MTLISQLISLSAVRRGSARMTSPSRRRRKRRSVSEMSHLLPHLPAGDGDITTFGYQNVHASDATIGTNATIHPTGYSSSSLPWPFVTSTNVCIQIHRTKFHVFWKVINKNMFVVKICQYFFFVEILIIIRQERTTTGKAINQYPNTTGEMSFNQRE